MKTKKWVILGEKWMILGEKWMILGALVFSATVLFAQDLGVNRFVPAHFEIFERIDGDLNKDGLSDCVLYLRGSDENNRNKGGIIVLFQEKGEFICVCRNSDCFSTEGVSDGVYEAPDFLIEVNKSKLFITLSNGRYGATSYTFRYDAELGDFALIGLDKTSTRGPVTDSAVSINFLTKKLLKKVNTNRSAETDGEEVFKESWMEFTTDYFYSLAYMQAFVDDDIATKVLSSACLSEGKNAADFVPEGLDLVETIEGDLNKDGLADCVLRIKGATDLNATKDGLIILFKNEKGYKLAEKNYTCLALVDDYGEEYLQVNVKLQVANNKFFVKLSSPDNAILSTFTFRYQDNTFKLIGFDYVWKNEEGVTQDIRSINFLTLKMQTKTNTNYDARKEGEQVFEEKWENFTMEEPLLLRNIYNFQQSELLGPDVLIVED